jgi:uncharacterized membrane protein
VKKGNSIALLWQRLTRRQLHTTLPDLASEGQTSSYKAIAPLGWFATAIAHPVFQVASLFWLVCTSLVLIRYYGFYPSYATFDQGIFNQVFWNSLHGNWFESSLSSTESIAVAQGAIPDVAYHRLGQHFTPSLLLWLPFYAVFPSPAGLSILQVTLVTMGGVLLYALARHHLEPRLSVWITVSYYLANAVIGPTLANFHDFSQIPLFVFGLLLAMERRQWWLFWLLSGLTLMVREDAGVILFGIGAYLLVSRRYPLSGALVCVLSMVYVVVLTNLIMPLFSEDISSRFMVEQFGHFVDGEEASTLDVLWAIATQPWLLVQELITPIGRTIRYLLAQGLPLGFIPLVAPISWLTSGFYLLLTLVRQDPSALMIDRRYGIALVPGLFYGVILWWKAHPHWFQFNFRRYWRFCLMLALVLTLTSNPNRALSVVWPDSFQPWIYTNPTRQWQHVQAIHKLMNQIPPDASVSSSSFIVPHLSNRREALRFPQVRLRNDAGSVIAVDYAVVDLWQFQQYQAAYPWEREQLENSIRAIARLLSNQRYGAIALEDGVVLLQRSTESAPQILQDLNTLRNNLQSSPNSL